MPREFSRKVRVAESIKRALASSLADWMREQGGGMASIVEVDVSPDLKRARVFLSLYGCDDTQQVIKDINTAAPQFRHSLGDALRLRTLPKLEFGLDQSIAQGDRMNRLLSDLEPDSDE